MKYLVIAGGGFAGFWSTVSAVRQATRLGKREDLNITLINRDEYHGIRPRFYEAELEPTRVPLEKWLGPLGVELIVGEIIDVSPASRNVRLADGRAVAYDRLILATGSRLSPPDALRTGGVFNTDTFENAVTLDRHLHALAASGFPTRASRTFVVVGGGLTGLELVTALPARLERLAPSSSGFAFHLVERAPEMGLGYAPDARRHIVERLQHLGITVHTGEAVLRHERDRLMLANRTELSTNTVIVATGFTASPLGAAFCGPRDDLGRLRVDAYLRLPEHPDVLAAGDVSVARTDPDHCAVMSCQHAMPQGKFAGHNAVNLLFNQDPIPYGQPLYRTCLDLGPGEALATAGWERHLRSTGVEAKALKTEILTQWIYPPADIAETLAMAAPVITS